jgi:hypothetical protein
MCGSFISPILEHHLQSKVLIYPLVQLHTFHVRILQLNVLITVHQVSNPLAFETFSEPLIKFLYL